MELRFKYLEFTINRRASLKHCQHILIKQALRAKATLECYLNKHKHMPVKVVFELFDTLVKPVVMFNSETISFVIYEENVRSEAIEQQLFHICRDREISFIC